MAAGAMTVVHLLRRAADENLSVQEGGGWQKYLRAKIVAATSLSLALKDAGLVQLAVLRFAI